jgi:ubiquitin C-terminal hydrolase
MFGLTNSNASCYINAVIQIAYHAPFVWKPADPSPSSLSYHFNFALSSIKNNELKDGSRPRVYDLITLKQAIYTAFEFSAGRQQDAHELLVRLLDVVADPVVYTIKSTKILQCTEGRCQHQTIIREEDSCVNLSISENDVFNVDEHLDAYYPQNILVDDYKCDKCGSVNTTYERSGITHQPQILIVVIKKYTQTPREIRISPTSGAYTLVGIIHHVGSASSGHYFVEVKRPTGEGWVRIDDAAVSECETYSTSSAYVVVYTKRTLTQK